MWEVRWSIYDNVYKMQQAITLRIGRCSLQCPWCIPRLWKQARSLTKILAEKSVYSSWLICKLIIKIKALYFSVYQIIP